MKYQIKTEQDVVIIDVSGSLDSFTTKQLEEELDSLINAGKFNYILDLEETEYLGSTGLNVLIEAQARVKKHGGEIKIVCCATGGVLKKGEKLFKSLFKIYPQTGEALKDFPRSSKITPLSEYRSYENVAAEITRKVKLFVSELLNENEKELNRIIQESFENEEVRKKNKKTGT